MIAIRFDGRLGNQLFQYVFLKYIQQREPQLMVFFSNPHHAYLEKYFELEENDNLLLASKAYSGLTRFLPSLLRLKTIFVHNWIIPKEFKIKNWSHYRGYFQSDYYYHQLKKKPAFNIKKEFKSKFETEFGSLFNHYKTVVVHIRRTDYMNYGERRKRDISLPMGYFKERLNAIKNLKEFANPKEVKESCIKINSYENIADDVLSQGIVDVFESNDPIKIIKVKSVLEYLEIVTDKAEDVANTIENIVIKYA